MSEHVHILIVEDSKTQAVEIKYFLVQSGYDVSVCYDGEEAWTFMQKQEVPPSLVISDIIMPKMDGYELCEKIRQHEKFSNVMVMLLTALTEPTDIIKGLKSLADSFLIKPYNKKFLLSRIGQLLEYQNFIKEMPTDMGLAVDFFGQRQFLTSNRVQVINNLLSVHDTVETQGNELKRTLKAEKALLESEAHLLAVLNSTADGILVIGPTGKVLSTNQRFAELWQIPEELLKSGDDKVLLDFVLDQLEDAPDFLKEVHRLYGTDEESLCTIRFKDGRLFERFTRPVMIGDHRRGRLWSFRDITARKQAEDEKAKLEAKYRQAQKMESIGLLAGGVAHDLNNVLSGIVSYPELMLMTLPEGSKLRKPLETMRNSGLRAAAIVQDLLTIARGVATTREPLNLNPLILEYLSSPEFNALQQYYPEVSVKSDLDDTLLNINASHVHIRKVVMNLVANAAEAIKGSGNVMISTVNRYLDRPLKGCNEISRGEYAVLSVSDDGSGISSNDLERIFEPFYTKKKMGRSGTGLGLTVVWNVMQDHKGYIDVATGDNGTTFELYFPITRDAILKKDIPLSAIDHKGNGETILVVDDVESQLEISCSILDMLNYKSKAVSSGEEAVEYLKDHRVDLVLLDMIMDPGINGHETYKRIIKIHPGQKAIIFSGFSETDDVKKTQELGAGQFINKPVTLEKIGLAIKEELQK